MISGRVLVRASLPIVHFIKQRPHVWNALWKEMETYRVLMLSE